MSKQKAMFISIIFHLIIYKKLPKGKYTKCLFLLFLHFSAFAQTGGFDGWNLVKSGNAAVQYSIIRL